MIIGGGQGAITFNQIEGPTAYGQVVLSSEAGVLRRGPVVSTLFPYGLGRLDESDGGSAILCGPRYLNEAPEEVRRSYPCGAQAFFTS